MANVQHLQRTRRNPFSPGETTNGTLCSRVAVCVVGMNLTDKPEEVTCKLCLRRMKAPKLERLNYKSAGATRSR